MIPVQRSEKGLRKGKTESEDIVARFGRSTKTVTVTGTAGARTPLSGTVTETHERKPARTYSSLSKYRRYEPAQYDGKHAVQAAGHIDHIDKNTGRRDWELEKGFARVVHGSVSCGTKNSLARSRASGFRTRAGRSRVGSKPSNNEDRDVLVNLIDPVQHEKQTTSVHVGRV